MERPLPLRFGLRALWGLLFWGVFFLSIFLVFSRKNHTFLTFWTDFLSFPLGFRWFSIGKTVFLLDLKRISCHFP